jgi:Family of unknown function (DUF6703)
MSGLPSLLVPAIMLLLMLVGLAAPLAVALPALLVIIAFVSWLAFLSWPVLPSGQRAMRVLVIGLVVLAAVGRLAGWF